MVSRLTGVELHDHNCGMKCYRREIFDEVTLYGELHRFVPVLADARGYRVGERVIQHRPRQFGQSKYGLTRFVKGFLGLLTVKFLTGFGQAPAAHSRNDRPGFVPARRPGNDLFGHLLAGGAQVRPDLGLLPLHMPPRRDLLGRFAAPGAPSSCPSASLVNS